jgi:hypothetical protein
MCVVFVLFIETGFMVSFSSADAGLAFNSWEIAININDEFDYIWK